MRKTEPKTIYWTEAHTTLCDVIFYGTATGLLGIELSTSSPAKQMKNIGRNLFPDWKLIENPRPIHEHISSAIHFIHMNSTEIPTLVFHGTPFQIAVWKELMRTKMGETLSYADLAARIGKPNAVRAVASAVAKNHFAILVPCHRVIRKDGSLGEYRWGKKLKERLLQKERTNAHRVQNHLEVNFI